MAPWARIAIALSAAAIAGPALAAPQCRLAKYLDLPVQMAGQRAIVTAKIGGREARFILDSGAFFSTISRATAAEYGLHTVAAPSRLHLRGINGDASADMTTVAEFELGGVKVPQVQFIVGGSDTGTVGLLGQNFLSRFDVEYDFPHGAVRLMQAKNCPDVSAAYWAGTRPVTMVPLLPGQQHTIGAVTLNGVKLNALFDSGAVRGGLTLGAAKRVGVRPDSPGVTPAGFSTGIGSKAIPAYLATFDTINIGGEAIPHPRIHFSGIELGDADMLIGFDFFLTHRIFVLNSVARMLVTYEGGSVFGLTPTGERDANGARVAPPPPEAAPKDAEGYARRGAFEASAHDLDAAIADFDSAVALAPGEARYLKLRAQARLGKRQPLLAMNDLEKAIAIDPADPETHQDRATLKIAFNDHAGALEDLQAMDRLLPPSADKRLMLAGLYGAIDHHAEALPNFDAWLQYHPEDVKRPEALNGRCWTRALLDRDIDKALGDCNAALRARPNTPAYLDSRALVHLRRGEWALAKADYDAAIPNLPHNALALYARGLAKKALGDATGAEADRAAAVAIQPAIAERAKRLGLDG